MRLFVLFVVCAAVFGGIKEADAWVEGYQPFPEGEATVLVHRFCWASNCDYSSDIPQWHWEAAIDNAARAWSNAGSNFRFSFESFSADANHDPCQPRDGYVYVVLVDPGPLCPGDQHMPRHVSGGTVSESGWSRVYVVNADYSAYTPEPPRMLQQLLLHEFGHVAGLGHPDEAGQDVRAIMNSTHSSWSSYRTQGGTLLKIKVPHFELQPDDSAGIQALYPANTAPPALFAGALENPTLGSIKSGIGLLSGWACEAAELEVSFDGGPRQFVPYGSERSDTAYAPDGTEICGDTDNGFGLLINYNNLGNGSHTVTLYADGERVVERQFTVQTLGTDFLRNVTGTGTVTLSDGKEVTVEWEEATQNFVITDIE